MPLKSPAPTSQKHRPISFVLDNRAGGIAPVWVPLVIRPEDLTRRSPTRAMLHQTLDTERPGWVDSFGPGLPTLTISGHTGWRAPIGFAEDGAKAFETLYRNIYERWHEDRQSALNSGRDPSDVKLLFVDELDRFTYEVFVSDFTLRRSKSRPLLMQYNIVMQAVNTLPDTPPPPAPVVDRSILGRASLLATLTKIKNFATNIAGIVTGTLGALARDFLKLTSEVLSVAQQIVSTVRSSIDTVAGAFLSVASDLMQAGRNIFWTINAIASLPAYAKARVMEVAGAYHNAFCLFSNAFRLRRNFPNYADLYGASGCSSTGGGRSLSPLAGVNPFTYLAASDAPLVKTNMAAQQSLTALKNADPVLSPMADIDLRGHLKAVTGGIVVPQGAFA